MTSGAQRLLQFCPLGVTTSWDEGPSGSAGVPPAPSLPQPRPSPPTGSTGSGAMALLRPGRCGSRRQGGWLPHRKETERHATGEDAGGTPALPGVSSRWCGGGYPAGDFSESRPAPLGETPVRLRAMPLPSHDIQSDLVYGGVMHWESKQCREPGDCIILPEGWRLEWPAGAVDGAFIHVRTLGETPGGRG